MNTDCEYLKNILSGPIKLLEFVVCIDQHCDLVHIYVVVINISFDLNHIFHSSQSNSHNVRMWSVCLSPLCEIYFDASH